MGYLGWFVFQPRATTLTLYTQTLSARLPFSTSSNWKSPVRSWHSLPINVGFQRRTPTTELQFPDPARISLVAYSGRLVITELTAASATFLTLAHHQGARVGTGRYHFSPDSQGQGRFPNLCRFYILSSFSHSIPPACGSVLGMAWY